MEAQLLALSLLAVPGAVVGALAVRRRRSPPEVARALARLDEELAALQRAWVLAGSPTDPIAGEDAFLTLYRTRHAHPVLDGLVASGRLVDLPAEVVAAAREVRAAILWWEEVANDAFIDLAFEAEIVDVGEGVQGTLQFLAAFDEVELRVEQLRETLATHVAPR